MARPRTPIALAFAVLAGCAPEPAEIPHGFSLTDTSHVLDDVPGQDNMANPYVAQAKLDLTLSGWGGAEWAVRSTDPSVVSVDSHGYEATTDFLGFASGGSYRVHCTTNAPGTAFLEVVVDGQPGPTTAVVVARPAAVDLLPPHAWHTGGAAPDRWEGAPLFAVDSDTAWLVAATDEAGTPLNGSDAAWVDGKPATTSAGSHPVTGARSDLVFVHPTAEGPATFDLDFGGLRQTFALTAVDPGTVDALTLEVLDGPDNPWGEQGTYSLAWRGGEVVWGAWPTWTIHGEDAGEGDVILDEPTEDKEVEVRATLGAIEAARLTNARPSDAALDSSYALVCSTGPGSGGTLAALVAGLVGLLRRRT